MNKKYRIVTDYKNIGTTVRKGKSAYYVAGALKEHIVDLKETGSMVPTAIHILEEPEEKEDG